MNLPLQLILAGTVLFSPLVVRASVTPDLTQTCVDNAASIEDKLHCIPGLAFTLATPDPALPSGIKHFEITFSQPVDHSDATLGTFSQRLVLLHRSESEPMVLQTSGYSIFGVRQSALAIAFATNQIQVEHRFFSKSSPETKIWSKLDIKQSADDFHRITVELKKIYKKSWVGTGASKGGMTSVYHRYFYPDDLDGTVADVAPLSFSTSDERYVDFVNHAGGDAYADCRTRFKKMQRRLLEHRDEILPLIEGEFTQLGSADIALEHDVIESHFIFWQYADPEDLDVGCAKIPEDGSAQEMFDYLQKINDISSYTDLGLEGFSAYYYQAATQLGNPGNITDHLQDLLKFDFTIDQYTPKGVQYSYSNDWMLKINDWAKDEADHIMFVYGQFDPWSAGAFPAAASNRDSHLFTVKAGNHSSKFTKLDDVQRTAALETLTRWFHKAPAAATVPLIRHRKSVGRDTTEDLEDFEFMVRRRNHL
jgi:PS-10 peptidase S37